MPDIFGIDPPKSPPFESSPPIPPCDGCGLSVFWITQDEIAYFGGPHVLDQIPAIRHSRVTRKTFEELAKGQIPVRATANRPAVARNGGVARHPRVPGGLTDRERAVLALLVHGHGNQQIASQMGISIHGAKRHVSNLLVKFDCRNRTEMALAAIKLGVVPPPEAPWSASLHT